VLIPPAAKITVVKFSERETAYVQDLRLTEYLLSRTDRNGKYRVKLLRAIEFKFIIVIQVHYQHL
jgi:hypothetical protein